MKIELNWQDQDSSSGLSFCSVFPDGNLHKIMLCGGHVGRSHCNNLKDYKSKKVLPTSTKAPFLRSLMSSVFVLAKSTQRTVAALMITL